MHNQDLDNAGRTQELEVTLLFADLRASTELAASLAIDPLAC
jgi:class 3 adenylate cyclase